MCPFKLDGNSANLILRWETSWFAGYSATRLSKKFSDGLMVGHDASRLRKEMDTEFGHITCSHVKQEHEHDHRQEGQGRRTEESQQTS